MSKPEPEAASAIVDFRTGSVPATPDDASEGTLIASVLLPSNWMANAKHRAPTYDEVILAARRAKGFV